MEQLRKTFCRYDMICASPSDGGIEVIPMPEFFSEKKGLETDYAHVHNFYEIVWFQEGDGTHSIDSNEYPITANTVFFISPGQVHTFDEKHNQKGFVLKVCQEMLNESSDEEIIYIKYNVFNTDSAPFHHISDYDAAKMQVIVEAIMDENKQKHSIWHKEYLQALIKALIIHIERGIKERDTILSISKTSHKTFLAFRQKLEKNYRKLHTVKDYAALLNVSTKTLTNYVAECSPNTPLEIINGRIILEAKRLLKYSNMMIKEISYRLGFDDPSYFIKFFKRLVGVSPIDFREKTYDQEPDAKVKMRE